MKTTLRTISLFVLLLTVTACSNTRFLSVWVDKDYKGEAIDNAMVIGIAENAVNRKLYEDMFVAQLEQKGITAIASYKLIPEGIELNKESVVNAIKGKDIDAIFTTHLIGVEEKEIYHPPMTSGAPTGYNGLYNYYPTVNGYVTSPGYYTTHKVVKLETNLYDASTSKIIWTAQSSSFSPSTTNDVIKPTIENIIEDLQEKSIISSVKSKTTKSSGHY